jgi:hypothetical protein
LGELRFTLPSERNFEVELAAGLQDPVNLDCEHNHEAAGAPGSPNQFAGWFRAS